MKMLQRMSAEFCALVISITMTTNTSMGSKFDNEIFQTNDLNKLNNYSESLTALTDEGKSMSGKCGDNLTWVLNDEGTLTVSGTGAMYEGTFVSGLPWHDRTDIKSVIINEGVKDIGRGAFENCNNLSSVIIPDSVTSIHMDSFRGCSNLTSINLSDNITAIGAWAFCGSGLTTLTIPGSVICGDDEFFADCPNLKDVIIKDGFTTIGFCNFSRCQSLTTVSIPRSVDCIYYSAFSDCPNLIDIYYAGTEDEWNKIKFVSYRGKNTLENTTLHFGDSNLNGGGEPISDKVNFDDHTYQLIALSNITGKAVISYCKEISGYMAHINNAEENEFLRKLICDIGVDYAYFGYTDEDNEGKWQWVDGKTSQYTNWAAGEPNNEYGQEHYALINQNGYWNDGKFENDASNSGVVIICEFNTNTGVDVGDNTDTSDISSNSDSGGSNSDYSNSNSNSGSSENNDNSSVPQTDTNINNTTKDDVPDNSNPSSNIITVPFKERNVDFYWNDDLFNGSAFEYNNNLAIAALALSGSAESETPDEIKSVLRKMNFDEKSIVCKKYGESNPMQPACVFAKKNITVKGQAKTLVCTTVRGSTSAEDWLISDFIDGPGSGFTSSTISLVNELTNYLVEYTDYTQESKDDFVLLITGHSLGGAVASYLTTLCISHNLVPQENVFAYTFAAPRYFTDISKQYDNLFEVINKWDIVPNLGFPGNYLGTGHDGVFVQFTPSNDDQFLEHLNKWIPVILLDNMDKINNHVSETYMAQLLSNPPSVGLKKVLRKSFFVSVRCPVNVEVYNSDGNLLSRVINNTVDESIDDNCVSCMVEGDKKYLYIETDKEIHLKLTGTSSGTMEYSVQKLKSADDVVTANDFITYETVELEEGKTFYSEISNNDDIAEVNLYVVDPETNKPVKSVGLDGKETNLAKESHIWLYIVGAVFIALIIVIIVLIFRKKHKKQ